MAETKVLDQKDGNEGTEGAEVIETVLPTPQPGGFQSADSEFAEEFVKKPQGRPRKDGVVGGAKVAPIHFPTPKYRTYRSDSTNNNQTTKAGHEYVNSLPNWAKERGTLYVYRDWPILMPKAEDDFAYIDKVMATEAFQSDQDLLQRYGCGSYRVILNDVEMREKVITLFIVNLGGSDLKSFPPTDRRVNKPGELDETRAENRSYMAFLQGRGEAPDQVRGREDKENMATATVVDKLMDQVDKANERAVKATERAAQESGGKESAASLEVVKDAAMKSNDMLHKTFDQILEVKDRMIASAGGGGADMSQVLEAALKIAETIAGGKSGGADPAVAAQLQALQTQIAEMQNERIRKLERDLEKAEERTATRPAGQTGTLQEQLETLRGLKGIIDDIAGKSESNPVKEIAEDVAEAGGPWWLKPLMTTITSVIPAAASMYANYTANQSRGMGGPAAPVPYPFPVPGATPNAYSPAPGPIPFPGAPGPATAYQALPPGVQPAPNPAAPPQMTVAQLFDQIYTPLATHMLDPGMQDSERGTTFAAWFASGWEGEYEQLRKLGLETLTGEFMNHPRLGVLGQQQGPEKVGRFLKDFLEWEEGDGDDGGGEVPPPAPTPIAS